MPLSFDGGQSRAFSKKALAKITRRVEKSGVGDARTDVHVSGEITGYPEVAWGGRSVMNGAKLILSAGICLGIAVAMASGCGSSSSGPGPVRDSGITADARIVDGRSETGGARCDPFAVDLCPEGQTCCFSGLGGTCAEVGSCGAPFQVSCVNTATCGGSGVCCASVHETSTFDASPSGASGFGLTLACAASCSLPSFQVCMTSQDCPSGLVCSGGRMMMSGDPAPGFVLVCVPSDDGGVGLGSDASSDGGLSAMDAGGGDGEAGDASDGADLQ
jgi:hypothetical protein